jgi:uncharacterized protein YndB with AHSA1/START domain
VASTAVSVTIHRPPEDVFAVLTDPTLSPQWSANAVKGELITPGPPGIGSRRRAVVKSPLGRGTTESVMEVTDLEPNRMVALKLVESPIAGDARTRYTLTPVGNSTQLEWTWEMQLTGPLRLIERPLVALFGRGFQRDLNNLKRMMESDQL